MTDQELRIRVATVSGWTELMPSRLMEGEVYGFRPGKGPPVYIKARVPKFEADLNACAELERDFIRTGDCSKDGRSNRYYRNLDKLSFEPICYATARERCLAFVKTMKEEP